MKQRDWFLLKGNPFRTQIDLANAIATLEDESGSKNPQTINSRLSAVWMGRHSLSVCFQRKIKKAILAKAGEDTGEVLFRAFLEMVVLLSGATSPFQEFSTESGFTEKELTFVSEVSGHCGIPLSARTIFSLIEDYRTSASQS